LVLGKLRVENLDRDLALDLGVNRFKDRIYPFLANLAQDAIWIDSFFRYSMTI
jgi:hypothetical protein